NEYVLVGGVQRFDDGLGDTDLGGEDHPDALGALKQFDDDGGPADAFDGGAHVGAIAHERGRGHADLVAGEYLRRAKLVARVDDTGRGVGGVDIHLLELPHHRGTEIGDGRADAGDDRVVVAQRAS